MKTKILVFCWLVTGIFHGATHAADQPQWGEAWSRNMISKEKNLPESFDPKTGKNIKWSIKLGTETYSTPMVAGGRIYIGTNNQEPRDPKNTSDSGVLMCLDEKNGNLLWQLVVPKREEDPYLDWPKTGMSSPVTVEGNRVYLVNNRGEVMCLDARGFANGNDGPFRNKGADTTGPTDADILWKFDLTKGAGIWSHDGAHSSILIHGQHLYLNTGTGVDSTHKVIRTPDAPSLVVLDKRTGQLLARDEEKMATNIFHCTWSSPSMGKINREEFIFFAGGDGVIYAFEPIQKDKAPKTRSSKLQKVWQFDFDPTAPKGDIHKYLSNRREGPSNIYGMPVFHNNRIYAAGGGDIFWGKNEAWLKCIDATKSANSATNRLVWSYPLEKHVMSTPAIYNGCVFIADCRNNLHCVDAETGKAYWTHEIKGEVWASPLVADGKIYLGTRSGEFWILAASKEKKVIFKTEFGNPINGTATAANGVIYVATMNHLYAVKQR